MTITQQILQNERGVKPTDWIYLQEDLDTFPYLLPLRKAYTKSLLLVGSEKYEDELSKLACVESNRKNLFFYLRSREENLEVEKKNIPLVQKTNEKVNEVKSEEVATRNNDSSKEPILPKKSSRLVHFTEVTDEVREINEVREVKEIKEVEQVKESNENVEKEKNLEDVIFSPDIKVKKQEGIEEKLENIGTKASTPPTKEKPKSFTDWLSQPKKESKDILVNNNPNKQILNPTEAEASEEKPLQETKLNASPVLQTTVEIDKKTKVIDEFLSKNYKPKPQKTTSKGSDIDNANSETMSHLMTETLAEIYVEQHKYNKAIKAFTILRLKYPKKSDYFANRINEIRELKNN